MPTDYKPKPCRRCGSPKGDAKPRHMWYCNPCALLVRQEWQRAHNPCGRAHEWWPKCKRCAKLKEGLRKAAAEKSIATRMRNHPHWKRPQTDLQLFRYWQGKAHSMVVAAIKHGVLPKLDGLIACTDCGESAHEYDHRDYGRPLVVEPVCRCCNKARGGAAYPKPIQFAHVASEDSKAA